MYAITHFILVKYFRKTLFFPSSSTRISYYPKKHVYLYIIQACKQARHECEKSLDISLFVYIYIHCIIVRNSALTLRLKRIKLPFWSVLLCVLCIYTNIYIFYRNLYALTAAVGLRIRERGIHEKECTWK
jgi:hypothetical protein